MVTKFISLSPPDPLSRPMSLAVCAFFICFKRMDAQEERYSIASLFPRPCPNCPSSVSLWQYGKAQCSTCRAWAWVHITSQLTPLLFFASAERQKESSLIQFHSSPFEQFAGRVLLKCLNSTLLSYFCKHTDHIVSASSLTTKKKKRWRRDKKNNGSQSPRGGHKHTPPTIMSSKQTLIKKIKVEGGARLKNHRPTKVGLVCKQQRRRTKQMRGKVKLSLLYCCWCWTMSLLSLPPPLLSLCLRLCLIHVPLVKEKEKRNLFWRWIWEGDTIESEGTSILL